MLQVSTMNSDIYWFVHHLKTAGTSSFGNEFSGPYTHVHVLCTKST